MKLSRRHSNLKENRERTADSLLLSRQCSQQLREIRFAHLARGDPNHGGFQPASGIQDRDTIQFEKDQRSGKRGSFVAVDKRVILAQMIGVGGSHFIVIHMQPLTRKGGFRLREGGLQKRQIPKPVLAAIAVDLIGMDFDHFGQRQEKRVRHSRAILPKP